MIPILKNPTPRDLRLFGVVGLPAAATLAAFVAAPPGGARWALLAVAAASLVVGGAAPRALRLPFVGLQFLFFPVGLGVSAAVLLVVFYALVTPIGAVLRLVRRDPLARKFPGSASSYWLGGDRGPQAADYFRRF